MLPRDPGGRPYDRPATTLGRSSTASGWSTSFPPRPRRATSGAPRPGSVPPRQRVADGPEADRHRHPLVAVAKRRVEIVQRVFRGLEVVGHLREDRQEVVGGDGGAHRYLWLKKGVSAGASRSSLSSGSSLSR